MPAWFLVAVALGVVTVGPIAGGVGALGGERGPAPAATETAVTGTHQPTANGTTFHLAGLDDLVLPVGGEADRTLWNGTFPVTVTNTGTHRNTTWVEMRVRPPGAPSATPTDAERLVLDPGETQRVSLQPIGVISGGPGNYTVSVRANGTVETATVAVYFPRYTHFRIGNVSARGFGRTDAGRLLVPVENTAEPPNAGPAIRPSQGPAMIAVTVNGVVVAERRRWFAIGETRSVPISLPVSALAPGRNRVTVETRAAGGTAVDDRVSFTMLNESQGTDGTTGRGFGALIALAGAGAGLAARRGLR